MSSQRNTVQRQIILDALIKLNTHPTVDEVYTGIHKNHPSVSKATVYRNLRQLAQNGAIRRITMPDGLERYDGNNYQHYHFECKNCGGILDADIGYVAGIDEKVKQKYGFTVDEHDVVFKGTCSQCSETCK